MSRHFEDRKKGKVIIKSKENLTIIKALEMYDRVPEQWELLNKIEKLKEENNKLKEIINEFEKFLEEHEATYTLKKLKELKGEE